MKRECAFWVPVFILLLSTMLVACSNVASGETIDTKHDSSRLILATTTSTYDSGLLDYILLFFEQQHGIPVDVIAVGTGQALQMAAKGDVDVVLVHAQEREEAFVEAGFGTARYDVMYNDFVILGPPGDPADIGELADTLTGFTRIAERRNIFISRGDDSGTDIKEKSIWAMTGIEVDTEWYYATGQGMGAVLTIADELQAYTLSDRATYLTRKAEGLSLEILIEDDPLLFNPYGVISVNPANHPGVNANGAQAFIRWITSIDTQHLIASFKIENQALFVPDSIAWRTAQQQENQ